MLDNRTVRALNGPKRDRQIDTVLVNMERWRWLPRDLGAPRSATPMSSSTFPTTR